MPMSIGGKFRHGGDRVIHLRHERPSLWHAGLAKDIEDLWEPWMREADRLLEDAALVESVYEAQGATSAEPVARAGTDTRRSGAAAADPEACAELELRHIGAGSARESGLSGLHADRR